MNLEPFLSALDFTALFPAFCRYCGDGSRGRAGVALAPGAGGGGRGLGDVRFELPGKVQTRRGKHVNLLSHVLGDHEHRGVNAYHGNVYAFCRSATAVPTRARAIVYLL